VFVQFPVFIQNSIVRETQTDGAFRRAREGCISQALQDLTSEHMQERLNPGKHNRTKLKTRIALSDYSAVMFDFDTLHIKRQKGRPRGKSA
jgi:hypothetical protein